ncbi:TPA: hypothetical protein ACQVKS_000900 [Serratia marcescens]|uniref:Uncharacterized protein n=1 Tax=Serratia nevei TaxID=2703794 RepID=A0ABT7G6X5_9GAMM|nr:hypothetical protein [Serratia nevei]HAU4290894.1 hypothetical protein [Serratia marcescens]MDK5169066.1 hypothetical protein [Serratia nevei]MDK5298560.1 hypothetical protein [Serratia nevei]MEC5887188.1 hypothetical protein [Serratia nevei]HAU4297452.1 hypothetical protein [Serratia marcescens]
MEIDKMNKMLFSNVQELLASLNDRERANAISMLEKKDILGNKTLENDFLFQYNAALYQARCYEQQKELYEKNLALFDRQKKVFNELIDLMRDQMTSMVNVAVGSLKAELDGTVLTVSEQVSRVNITITNLVDNIFSYIDRSMHKMLVQIADEKDGSVNELKALTALIESQLKSEVQKMIVELVENYLPDELKKSVKEPISHHLKHYSGTANKLMAEKFTDMEKRVKNMETKVNAGHDPWSVVRVIRDIVVFGGVLFAFKLLHFI